MTGGLIRILACVWFAFTASQASADNSVFDLEHRWLTLFGGTEDLALPLDSDSSNARSAIIEAISRTYPELDSTRVSSYDFLGNGHFRRPDPEFGLPEAFRRPRQARLVFRLRF